MTIIIPFKNNKFNDILLNHYLNIKYKNFLNIIILENTTHIDKRVKIYKTDLYDLNYLIDKIINDTLDNNFLILLDILFLNSNQLNCLIDNYNTNSLVRFYKIGNLPISSFFIKRYSNNVFTQKNILNLKYFFIYKKQSPHFLATFDLLKEDYIKQNRINYNLPHILISKNPKTFNLIYNFSFFLISIQKIKNFILILFLKFKRKRYRTYFFKKYILNNIINNENI